MEHGFENSREERQAPEEIPGDDPYQQPGSSRRGHMPDDYIVHSDLPEIFPVTHDETALLRAFLSEEIRAILHGEDSES